MSNTEITIIGGGLAGSEAAWQAARAGAKVLLYEMRPKVKTAVHQTGDLAELVCSNSLKSNDLSKATGLLKHEMRRLDSLIIAAADSSAVPAGSALAVDRVKFAAAITQRLEEHVNITIVRDELQQIPKTPTIVATGPMTSPALAKSIQEILGDSFLNFFDAVAPIVDADSLDYDRLFLASRYDKGDAAYWNSPLTEAQYDVLREALLEAEISVPHNPEDAEVPYFESCLPIEELARRGRLTMRFGALRGAGLTDPKTGRWPFACVQLRPENQDGTMYNLVGFQTRLKWGDQTKILRLLPGLENVEIVRFGVIHKNIFLNAPSVLKSTFQTQSRADLFFAGQLTGVEGYVESSAAGLLAGMNAARFVADKSTLTLPRETALGALTHYMTTADPAHYQPMNSNWALLPPLPPPPNKKKWGKDEKAQLLVQRAQSAMDEFLTTIDR